MKSYTVHLVLEVSGSVEVEADSITEAYLKVGENPGKYSDPKSWNGVENAELRAYSHINCVWEHDVTSAVFPANRKEENEE